jgi:hypothetical protein
MPDSIRFARPLAALFAAFVALPACVGARSTLTVPRCVERVEIDGEHTRVGDDTFVFHHMLDLPFTSTEVTVEKPDQTTETIVLVNTMPDIVHLVGAALTGSISALLVSVYAYQVTAGGEQFLGPSLWALPIGVLGLAFATTLVFTGWHPLSDTVLETTCSEP